MSPRTVKATERWGDTLKTQRTKILEHSKENTLGCMANVEVDKRMRLEVRKSHGSVLC